ncbi:MAG: heme exporter protein B [Hyphomicrobiaceae bacterium]|jgi:heme exporter protein B
MSVFMELLRRELAAAVRDGGSVGTVLGFYAIAVAMMPIAIGPDLKLLGRIAPGVLWISMLLAALLSLGRLFERDVEDGTLDLFAMSAVPLEVITVVKSLAHWLTTCLPLVLLTPVLGLFLNVDFAAVPMIIVTMLVGTVAVSFLGAIAAALTLRSKRGGVLVALLVLPMYVPTLIYGISTVSLLMLTPGSFVSPLLLLSAISLVSLVIGPIASAAVLRFQMQ